MNYKTTNDKIKRQEIWDPDAYKIKIKISETEFEFQSSDRRTLEEIGIPLLLKTFSRFEDFKIKKI